VSSLVPSSTPKLPIKVTQSGKKLLPIFVGPDAATPAIAKVGSMVEIFDDGWSSAALLIFFASWVDDEEIHSVKKWRSAIALMISPRALANFIAAMTLRLLPEKTPAARRPRGRFDLSLFRGDAYLPGT
jgi:hypothetical protein